MTTQQEPHADVSFGIGFDFTDPELLAQGLPLQEFATLRRTAPVWWNEQDPAKAGGFHDGGYWVISKHADIREISRNPATWSSNHNGCVMRYTNDVSPQEMEAAKLLMHNTDPPVHTRLRKLVSRMFTPRNVATLEKGLRSAAEQIVVAAAARVKATSSRMLPTDCP